MVFSKKSIILALTSMVTNLNVYVFCTTSIVLALFQNKIYRSENYNSEVIFYRISSVIEIMEAVLTLSFKIFQFANENKLMNYAFIGCVFGFILMEFLAIVVYWVKFLRSSLSKSNKNKVGKAIKSKESSTLNSPNLELNSKSNRTLLNP